MKFILYRRCSGCETLIGAVTYVLPDSDAATKGVVRGDLFNAVDGQELTLSNYVNLLYGPWTKGFTCEFFVSSKHNSSARLTFIPRFFQGACFT